MVILKSTLSTPIGTVKGPTKFILPAVTMQPMKIFRSFGQVIDRRVGNHWNGNLSMIKWWENIIKLPSKKYQKFCLWAGNIQLSQDPAVTPTSPTTLLEQLHGQAPAALSSHQCAEADHVAAAGAAHLLLGFSTANRCRKGGRLIQRGIARGFHWVSNGGLYGDIMGYMWICKEHYDLYVLFCVCVCVRKLGIYPKVMAMFIGKTIQELRDI